MNMTNQSNLPSVGKQQSKEARLYDLTVLCAFTVVALVSILMHALPFLTAIAYTSVIGPALCLPWLSYKYKMLDGDKQAAKVMFRAIVTYTSLASVFFAVVIRLAVAGVEFLFGFL